MMRGHPGSGVFGVVHRVNDQLAHVLVLQAVEDRGAHPAGRTSRAIRSLARCCDTDGAGFATFSANSLTDNSPSANAHNTWIRVESANIRNTSTTRPTWSSSKGVRLRNHVVSSRGHA